MAIPLFSEYAMAGLKVEQPRYSWGDTVRETEIRQTLETMHADVNLNRAAPQALEELAQSAKKRWKRVRGYKLPGKAFTGVKFVNKEELNEETEDVPDRETA